MKRLLQTNLMLGTALALAVISGAACNPPTTEVTINSNNANMAVTPTPAASPSPAMSGQMSGMDHGQMMKSSPDAASAPYDLQFIDTMMAHHKGAIDMATMAETKAQHGELKTFAAQIVADQQKENAQMKQWRERWYAGKPEAVNMEMPGMMDSMKDMDMKGMNTASGNAFDLMFLDMMTPHHEGAIQLAREALQ